MRTRIDLNDELYRRAKKRAADEHVSLRGIVETALRRYLAGRPERGRYRLRWTPEKGRVLPGVDLDDRKALFRLMDRSGRGSV